MARRGKAFHAELSCPEVFQTTGDLRYYFVLFDAVEELGKLGSAREPFRVNIETPPPGVEMPPRCELPPPWTVCCDCERDDQCESGRVCRACNCVVEPP